MDELDDLHHRIAAIADELAALPSDAFARRLELRMERDELRGRLAGIGTTGLESHSTASLLAELEALREQLRQVRAQRIDVVMQSGGGAHGSGGGADGWGAVQLNQRIEAAGGADELKRRIGLIEGILIDRRNAGQEVATPTKEAAE